MRDCNLINEFADFLRYARHRAEKTVESYIGDIEQFIGFLGTNDIACGGVSVGIPQDDKFSGDVLAKLENVCTDKVRAFMDYLHDRQYSQASIRRKLASLVCLYDFMCAEKLLDFNPTSNVRLPDTVKHKPKFLTDEQIYRLLHLPNTNAWLGVRDKAILELLCTTGMRVSELTALNINDIDTERYILRITSQSGKTRLLSITASAVESVVNYIKIRPNLCQSAIEQTDNNALFINKFGKRLDARSADRRIEKYIEMAGLSKAVSPYDLRHSFAKKLLNNGANAEQLRQKLGFESLTSAKSYAEALMSENVELQQVFFN